MQRSGVGRYIIGTAVSKFKDFFFLFLLLNKNSGIFLACAVLSSLAEFHTRRRYSGISEPCIKRAVVNTPPIHSQLHSVQPQNQNIPIPSN